uniref:ATP--guanido phosphotransferase n=1 Tax=Anaerococcus mediterraneensis TaxID=1870984 RepID=UPI000AE02E02|nr:ATP--guanido phosphotransferase [Anaerococcus mediterraneensis]
MDYNKDIILESNLAIRRNIKGYDFPTTMTYDESLVIIDIFKNIFEDRLVLISDLDDSTIDRLIEKMVLSPDCREKLGQIGLVFEGDTTLVINDRDHLSINISDFGENLESAYMRANEIEKVMDERIDFAFSPELGYLTSHGRNTGAGLEINYKTFLFGLIDDPKTYYGFKQALIYAGMYVKRFVPKGLKSYADDIYIIKNYGNYRDDIYIYLDEIAKNMETIVKNEIKFRRDYKILNDTDDREIQEDIKIIENNLEAGLTTSLEKMVKALYDLKKYLILGYESKFSMDDLDFLIKKIESTDYKGNFNQDRLKFLEEYIGDKNGK